MAKCVVLVDEPIEGPLESSTTETIRVTTKSAYTKPDQGPMKHIEFRNSPYLDLASLPDDVVPIIVMSKAVSIEVRDAVRRTWGFDRAYANNTLRIKTFFLVGTDDFMTQRIRMEQVMFDDVIHVNVPDMYSFSAYKEIAAMMWVRSFLPKSLFYVKVEDDVIINMRMFVTHLLPRIRTATDQHLILGWYGSEHTVKRGAYQKFVKAVYSTSSEQLNYAMSLMYAVTAVGVDSMLETLNDVELIEYPGDPFVTGILRDAGHVDITDLAKKSGDFSFEMANGACKMAFEKNPTLLICLSSSHASSTQSIPEYFEAWNVLIAQMPQLLQKKIA